MKHAAKLLCLLLSLLLLAGCAPAASEDPNAAVSDPSGAAASSQGAAKTEQALESIRALGESPDDEYRTWYEIFVYSYCDSDGDGVGDLAGVRSKLDELQALGINGIWLMPIHPSTSYHKYNVSDYYAIDPAYGTMEDMEALLADCAGRGIRVILDLVVNHTGSEHPWFKEAVAHLQSLPAGAQPDPAVCPTVDYYNFAQAESCPAGYHEVTGAAGWYYESRFSYDMPDLNLDSPAVREEIKDIMAFWLEKGAAGFRLDAAKEFWSGNAEKNLEVLNWIETTGRALDPDCYFVAEVWDSFANITTYYKSGITSIFDYAFGNVDGKIVSVLRGAGQPDVVSTYATALEKADAAYLGSNPAYIDAPFLSNHDVGRIAGFVGRTAEKTKLAGAMNLFMSGSVFVYYGEELGMICGGTNDPSYRAPMLWDENGTADTPAPPPECELPEEYLFGGLAQQKGDDGSVYNYYRQAIAIRQAIPAISHGRTTAETALNTGCVSAQRKSWEGEECILLMNLSAEAAGVDLTAYADWTLAASLVTGEEPVAQEGAALHLPAWGVAVLTPAA